MNGNVLLYFTFLAASSTVLGNEIDLTQTLNDALFNAIGDLPMPGSDGKWRCHKNGEISGGPPLLAAAFKCSLKYNNVRSISVTSTYTDPIPAAIPTTVARAVRQYVNCNSEPIKIQDTISVSTSEGIAITKSTDITEGGSVTTTSSIQVPVKAIQFSMSKQENTNFSIRNSESQSNNLQSVITTTQSIAFDVPPMHTHQVILEREVSNAFIRFNGLVILDADVNFIGIKREDGSPASSITPVGQLSKLVPSESARTVTLSGEIWNAKGLKDNRKDIVAAIADPAKTCEAPKIEVYSDKVGLLSKVISESNDKLVSDAVNLPDVQRMFPLVNGMSITTSNSVANVEVRAQSQGPGFCGVSINGGMGNATFLAPPFTWSPWTTLFSHIGSVSTTVNTSVECDTGALFEIRYYQ